MNDMAIKDALKFKDIYEVSDKDVIESEYLNTLPNNL